jgi:tetratricopeptide (TPR) repeat protein
MAWDLHRDPAAAALEALTSLVDNNLVVQQQHGGKPRFTLLETICAFALERLAERGEEETVRQRHADYYLHLAEEADRHLRSAEQQVWLDRLEAERGNLRAALSWFLDRTADAEAGLRLAGALGQFWIIRGHVSEGRHWSARALQRGCHAAPALRSKVLFRAGMLAWPGDLPLAHSLVEEGLLLLRELGRAQQWELAYALTGFAMIMAYQGNCDAAQSASEEALALYQQLHDPWGVALALATLGEAHLLRHDYPGACSRFEESLALFRQTGDRWGIGIPLLNWGYTDSIQGNLDPARARLEESNTMHRQVGECVMRSLTLNVLAQVVQQQGDTQQAAVLYAESLDLLRKMGLEARGADLLCNLAYLVQSQGHYLLAARQYRESLALFAKQGNEAGMARCHVGLAAIESGPGHNGYSDQAP